MTNFNANHTAKSPSRFKIGTMASTYCKRCRRTFQNQQSLHQHLKSPQHNGCSRCKKPFSSTAAKLQHLRDSPRHNNVRIRCPDDLDLETDQDLDTHLSPHKNKSITKEISDTNTSVEETCLEYLGIPRSVIKPIYDLALGLRFRKPTVDSILSKTKTTLDHAIIAALITAALRLVPVDNTPKGIEARKEKDRIRAAEAKSAEDDFFAQFSRLGYDCLNEDQQKGLSTVTPDVLFREPTSICGHLCSWLEYKDFFGFDANPFVAPKNKKQFRKYAEQLGPGAVVYRLGFETGHVDIEGVKVFREAEVRQNLRIQVSL